MPSRVKVLVSLLVVGVIAVGGAFTAWFFGGDKPAAVDLSTAVAGIPDDDGSDDATSPALGTSIEGIWTIDAEQGSFDFTSATGTFAGFRVEEELVRVGKTEAVGRTGQVDGEIKIEDNVVTAGAFTVDMASITTNDSRRDGRVLAALDTARHPKGVFTLSEPIELGDGGAAGDTVTATAKGTLTVHGVTREIEVPIEAKLAGVTIVVVGAAPVVFADYDVEVPSSRTVVTAEDEGIFEFQLLFTKRA